MNAATNEVLIRCKLCATSCAPWLSHCRKCGASMDSQTQNPVWSDGQANRELLDSLDAIGGGGSDLADQEVFKMLDEIERLTHDKLRASILLRGTGQANEPKLNPVPSAAKTAMLAEQFRDLPELLDAPAFLTAKSLASATNDASAQPRQSTDLSPTQEALRPSVAEPANVASEFKAEPSFQEAAAPLGTLEAQQPHGTGSAPSPQDIPKLEIRESKDVARSERVLELGQKKPLDPEKFLPPDFFDPRDRKRPKKWGRWLALALLLIGMTSLAGYLVIKTFKDNRPAAVRDFGDLTKPASK